MKKYIPVFGPQELFDGAPEDSVIAIKRPFIRGVRSEKIYFFSTTFDAVIVAGSYFNSNNVILKTGEYAERRIIKEPKRWTWENKKAGRLPEVGAKCRQGHKDEIVIAVTEKFVVTECQDMSVCTTRNDVFIRSYKPIETPEEKAQRLEDEFVNDVSNEPSRRMTETDCGFYTDGIRAAYRKLKITEVE